MPFPVHDWQFWVVTAAAILALAWLLKGVVPIPILSKRSRARKRSKRVGLTISAKGGGGADAKGEPRRHECEP